MTKKLQTCTAVEINDKLAALSQSQQSNFLSHVIISIILQASFLLQCGVYTVKYTNVYLKPLEVNRVLIIALNYPGSEFHSAA